MRKKHEEKDKNKCKNYDRLKSKADKILLKLNLPDD